MTRILLIMALTVGLGACASNATAIAESDPAGATAAEASKTKQHCYRQRGTGSRLGARICKDVEEASGS